MQAKTVLIIEVSRDSNAGITSQDILDHYTTDNVRVKLLRGYKSIESVMSCLQKESK